MKTKLLILVTMLSGIAGTAHAQEYCREFTQEVRVGGRLQEGYGTACRQPDGSWEIQKPAQTEDQMMGEVESTPSAVEYAGQPQPIYIDQQPIYVQPQPTFYGGVFISDRDRHYHRHRSRWEPRYGHAHHW